MRWPWSRKRKLVVIKPISMRQCAFCPFTGHPVEVLFHEVEVHKA
jgi:hypothetical protein